MRVNAQGQHAIAVDRGQQEQRGANQEEQIGGDDLADLGGVHRVDQHPGQEQPDREELGADRDRLPVGRLVQRAARRRSAGGQPQRRRRRPLRQIVSPGA